MEFDADLYNQTNRFQYRDAEELINKIKEENVDKKFDVVLDVGSGSGNITLLLNSRLTTNQLYAVDVDEEMIKFAKENHQRNSIQYLLQDFGQDWDQLRPELKALEGKVSLVFSNHVLHWISNKENAAKNLFRLLSKGGRIYAHIYWIHDPFSNLSAKEKEIHEKEVMKIPSKEEQLDIWINIFKNVGLLINENEFIVRKTIFDEQTFTKSLIPLVVSLRKQYLVEKDQHKRNEVMTKLSNAIFKRVYDKCRKLTDETTGETVIEFSYGFFRFVLQK